VRKVAQELSDTGTPLSLGEVGSSEVLTQLLEEASDFVLAACQVKKNYTEDDLDTLGSSTTSGFLLRRIVCDLAYGLLLSRRGRAASDIAKLAPMFVQAHQYINQLRDGILLFPKIDDTRAEAGVPKTVDLSTHAAAPVTWVQHTGYRVFPGSGTVGYGYGC
jgi:hypothetical protein